MANRREKESRQRKVVSAKKWASEHESGFSRTSLKVPEGLTIFNVKKAGTYRLDVIPYTVGEGNPHSDAGELHYERTYYIHARIGPNGDTYCCLAKTFNKPCPICEERAKMARDPDSDEKLVKSLFPKERNLWNVFVHSEPEKGVQVWDVSDHLFGKHLRAKINNADESDGYDTFADPEEGQTLKIGATEEKGGGFTWRTCNDIEFKSRKEPISEEIMSAAVCLDDMLVEMEYDKLKSVFHGEVPEGDGTGKKRNLKEDVKSSNPDDDDDDEGDGDLEEEAPKKKPQGKPKTNPSAAKGLALGMTVLHEEFGVCDITKISPDGTSLTLEDEDGEMHMAVGPDEVEKQGKASAKPGKNGDPDDDDDSDDEDSSDLEDDEDDDEESEDSDDKNDEDDEPEEKAPASKKKPAGKPPVKPGKRK